MASNKTARINDDIQRVMSDILRSIKDPRINQGMITVTRVETTGDLGFVKVYLSVLGENFNEKEFMKGIKSASGFIRRELSNSIKLRHTPVPTFVIDNSIAYGSHINQLISNLDIGGDENED